EVVRGQVGAAAEPCLPSLLDEAPVRVHRGNARVEGVEDEAQAGGEEAASFALEPPRELLLQLTPDRRDVHPGLLEDCAALEHPGPPAASARPLPDVLAKTRAAVLCLDRRAERALEVLDVLGHPAAEVALGLRGPGAHQCTGRLGSPASMTPYLASYFWRLSTIAATSRFMCRGLVMTRALTRAFGCCGWA